MSSDSRSLAADAETARRISTVSNFGKSNRNAVIVPSGAKRLNLLPIVVLMFRVQGLRTTRAERQKYRHEEPARS